MIEDENYKTIITLALVGALIGLSRLLVSGEPLSWRLIIGRTILGSAASCLAGFILFQIPNINLVALNAIACGLGILGSTFIEECLRKQATKWGGGNK